MSQVKYNRLSSADSGLEGDSSFAIDFRSPFSYKSVYTYSKSTAPYIGEERGWYVKEAIFSGLAFNTAWKIVNNFLPATPWFIREEKAFRHIQYLAFMQGISAYFYLIDDIVKETRCTNIGSADNKLMEGRRRNKRKRHYWNEVITRGDDIAGLEVKFINDFIDYKPSLLARVCSWAVIFISFFILFITFPISGWFAIKFVQQFERIVVFRLGRLQLPRGPGIVLVVPIIDVWKRVDLRVRAFNVPPQQLLTTDGTALNIGATVYFRITDAILSVASIQDLNHSVRILGQTVMMNLLCSRTKSEIENDKQYICTYMQEEMNAATQSWGVEVSRVELSESTVLFEPQDQHFNKFTGILGQLAQQLGGGGAALPSLLQPKLIPPGEDTKPTTPSTFEALPAESPEELMDSVRQIIDVQLVRDVGAIYLFKITGEKGGIYFLDLKIGLGEVGRGAPPYCEPDIVLTTTLHDLQSMLHGQLKPYAAYMSGRLKVDGDLRTAMLLEEVVKRLKSAKERNSPEEWVQLGSLVGHIPEK